MSRRSRSYDSDSGSDSPPRRSRKRRASVGRERSPYSPPRGYRSPRDDYYGSSSSSRSSRSYRVLCVTDIDSKVSDDAVKDALYKEFRRFGEVSVKIVHEPDERIAYISYKSSEDARYAKKNKPRIMFYDKPIHVAPVYEPDPYARRRSPPPVPSREWSPDIVHTGPKIHRLCRAAIKKKKEKKVVYTGVCTVHGASSSNWCVPWGRKKSERKFSSEVPGEPRPKMLRNCSEKA